MSARPPDRDLWKLYKDMYLNEDDPDGPVFQKDKRLTREIAARFSRGNVSLQNSGIIERDFVERVRKEMKERDKETIIRRALDFLERRKERK
jgi:hypothetical protein